MAHFSANIIIGHKQLFSCSELHFATHFYNKEKVVLMRNIDILKSTMPKHTDSSHQNQ